MRCKSVQVDTETTSWYGKTKAERIWKVPAEQLAFFPDRFAKKLSWLSNAPPPPPVSQRWRPEPNGPGRILWIRRALRCRIPLTLFKYQAGRHEYYMFKDVRGCSRLTLYSKLFILPFSFLSTSLFYQLLLLTKNWKLSRFPSSERIPGAPWLSGLSEIHQNLSFQNPKISKAFSKRKDKKGQRITRKDRAEWAENGQRMSRDPEATRLEGQVTSVAVYSDWIRWGRPVTVTCGALWGPVGSVTTSDKDGRDVQCLLRLSSVNSGLGTTWCALWRTSKFDEMFPWI